MICYSPEHASDIEFAMHVPVAIPDLATRPDELGRILDEYIAEAQADFGVTCDLSPLQRAWVAEHATDHPSLDKILRRILALRTNKRPAAAARQLGMAQVSLFRWMRRHGLTRQLMES